MDDNDVTLQTYATWLGLEGYVVHTAATPVTGLQEMQRGRPDAIILDLRLPETADGLQLLRDVRARANTPVAIVTGGYGLDNRMADEIRQLGARIVCKPLWLDALVELCASLVRRDGVRADL